MRANHSLPCRNRSGLRNRRRTGKGTYCLQRKGRRADSYGQYAQGRMLKSETIAGTTIGYELLGMLRQVAGDE